MKFSKLAIVFGLIISFSACNSKNDGTNGQKSAQMNEQKSGIYIDNPWIRPANAGTNSALFFTLINNTDKPDTLYNASSALAEVTEVHETYQKGADMMGMRHVDMVEISSGAKIEFKPRDLHVMLIKLKKDLVLADSGDVVLLFKNAGKVTIKAEIRDMPIIRGK